MRALLLALFLALTAACSKTAEPARRQLLVLRFENLTGSPELDWMERGAARQLAAQMDDTSTADSPQPAEERERAIATGTTRILHGYISRSGDRLRLRADLEDARSRSFARTAESTGPISAGLLPLASAVARQLDPNARTPGAKNEAALEAYIAGLNASDSASAIESLSRAVAADPDFGAAYLGLIQVSVSQRDRAAAERFLAAARARGQAISPIDRARIDVAAAQVSENPAALTKSLANLSRLMPADTNLLRTLAGAELAAKRYAAAIDYFKRALAAQPEDAATLNTLGYTQAYAGDLDGAVRSLGEYERIRPRDANPLDSLGEVYFFAGRFPESEKAYRRAYEKDATFLNSAPLMKAALARLLTGDLTEAETIFAEYEAARRRANDPSIELARARWDYFRGRRTDAVRRLQSFASTTRTPEADCTLAVWMLEAGDQAAAAKSTACRFLTDPSVPAPNPVARARALLLARNFAAATPLLREILTHAPPSPTDPTPTLLAWALVETGQFDEAERYLQMTPTPSAPGPDPFESLIFPRIFHLRAVVDEKKGAKADAERNDHLFRILSGS